MERIWKTAPDAAPGGYCDGACTKCGSAAGCPKLGCNWHRGGLRNNPVYRAYGAWVRVLQCSQAKDPPFWAGLLLVRGT